MTTPAQPDPAAEIMNADGAYMAALIKHSTVVRPSVRPFRIGRQVVGWTFFVDTAAGYRYGFVLRDGRVSPHFDGPGAAKNVARALIGGAQ